VYGSPLVLPGQFLEDPEAPSPEFFDELRLRMSGFQPTAPAHNISARAAAPDELPPDLLQAKYVLVRRDAQHHSLQPAYEGPYLVLKRSRNAFLLQLGGRTDTVSTHRLKAAYVPDNVGAAEPPRRGRPPVQRQVSFLEKAVIVM
jgi:hypothetical protein